MDVRIVIPLLASLTFLINLALTFARCDGSPFTFYKMDVNGDGECSDAILEAHQNSSSPYAANKECIALNLKSEDGRELVKRLAREVDVVFENFAPGTMDKFGIGAEGLRAENPRLIYASSTGYGTVGPYRDFLGMDITLQAMTGVMSIGAGSSRRTTRQASWTGCSRGRRTWCA